MKKKIAVSAIALVLVLCCAIGGTLAWLSDKTDPITNTFTVGNVDIDLTEPAGATVSYNFKMIPGTTLAKDPTVTVKANSEDCWLFVKVEKSEGFASDVLSYGIREEWNVLEGVENVYYREVSADDDDQNFYVLKGDSTCPNGCVAVADDVTNEELATLANNTLTFTAYAVQSEGFETAKAAWDATFGASTQP